MHLLDWLMNRSKMFFCYLNQYSQITGDLKNVNKLGPLNNVLVVMEIYIQPQAKVKHRPALPPRESPMCLCKWQA